MRAETSRRCLSPGGGLFYMRFRPVAYSPRTRKKTPQLGAEPNVTAHCAHLQPRSTETTKHGMRAETSRRCLSPGGGLFYMRFRPNARPDQLPPPERRIHTVFNGIPRTASHARPRPTETAKHGVRAETSRQCLSPGGGLFYMRLRPDARPDQLPPSRASDSHRFQRYRALRLTQGPDRPRPRNTACGQRRVVGA